MCGQMWFYLRLLLLTYLYSHLGFLLFETPPFFSVFKLPFLWGSHSHSSATVPKFSWIPDGFIFILREILIHSVHSAVAFNLGPSEKWFITEGFIQRLVLIFITYERKSLVCVCLYLLNLINTWCRCKELVILFCFPKVFGYISVCGWNLFQ